MRLQADTGNSATGAPRYKVPQRSPTTSSCGLDAINLMLLLMMMMQSTMHAFKEIYQKEGWAGLYRVFLVSTYRCFILLLFYFIYYFIYYYYFHTN